MLKPRLTYCSVTIFLQWQDTFLFLQRPQNKKVDAGRVNGIGGKLEPGEDYLTAAIRETFEETGYQIVPGLMKFAGIARIEGGYPEDWVVSFFHADVTSPIIPHGTETKDGRLFWAKPQELLQGKYELVDDLTICLPIIEKNKSLFFLNAQMDQTEKMAHWQLQEIPFS